MQMLRVTSKLFIICILVFHLFSPIMIGNSQAYQDNLPASTLGTKYSLNEHNYLIYSTQDGFIAQALNGEDKSSFNNDHLAASLSGKTWDVFDIAETPLAWPLEQNFGFYHGVWSPDRQKMIFVDLEPGGAQYHINLFENEQVETLYIGALSDTMGYLEPVAWSGEDGVILLERYMLDSLQHVRVFHLSLASKLIEPFYEGETPGISGKSLLLPEQNQVLLGADLNSNMLYFFDIVAQSVYSTSLPLVIDQPANSESVTRFKPVAVIPASMLADVMQDQGGLTPQSVSLSTDRPAPFLYWPLADGYRNVLNYTDSPWTAARGLNTYGGHQGTDLFLNIGTPVYAAASGVVNEIYMGCPDLDPSVNNYSGAVKNCTIEAYPFNSGLGYHRAGNAIMLSHTVTVNGNNKTWYSFYAHLKQNSQTIQKGNSVSRGAKIAESGHSGISSDPHFHFEIRNASAYTDWDDPWGSSNAPHDYPDDKTVWVFENGKIVAANSGGGSSDTTAPSGGFNIPTEGLTVNYPTVAISGWGQDNSGGSGFDHAHFTAYYNGAWHLISGDFTSSPFSFDWNLCNAGVPDGQVTLGLDVWDKAGNAAYSPGGVRHFNKSYNCGSSSGGGTWNARYFEGSSGWWDPASLNNATPKCTESLNSLDKNYGSSAPCGNGMSGDNWVGDYSASINFPAGNYVFIADHDDNFKLWLGSTNIADRGGSGSNDKVCPARFLSGTYNVRAMLYENGGDARIKLTWSTDTSLCVQPPATPSLSSPGNNDTVGRYDTVTLNWNAVSDATNYNVEFWGGPNYSISQTVSSPSLTIGSTFWGGIYQWKVSAVNNAGPSGWSETRTLNRKYGAPTYLNTSNITQNQASLSWGASADAPGNISGYRIYRNGSAINTVSSSSTTYTDSTLSCGNTYNFAVTAYSGGLESDSSVTQTVTTPACGASTPQLISPDDTATFNEGEAITLSWTATGTQFYGEISGGPAGTSTFGWQPEASKYIGPQWAGYTYIWKVMAKNSGGQSGYSPTRTFTVLPGKPTNLSTAGSTCSRVNLNWSDNSGSEQGYKVYRDSSLIATLGSNVTSYQDASVSNDITYSYSVSAYRGSIFSPASDAVSWTTACPPSNDHLANAAVISSLPFNTTQSTRGATIESSEPNYPVGWNNGSSVWYQFTPSITQAYAVDTFGSNYDTVLHVFERTSSGTLSLIQGDDDDTDLSVTQSKIIFTGVAGTTYFFSISQYNSTSGGSLTVNLSAVACPASSLCVTVTSPYYRASNLWISVRTDSGGYAGGVRADNYGYGVVSGITQGNYSVSVSGSHMLRFVNNISGPGNLNVSGVGLPSVQVSLKDINGTQLDSIAYLATNNGYYYVGYAYVNSPLELFATPGDYLLVQEGSTAKYLTYQDLTIQTGMNLTPVVYDVSQSPAQIFHYTVQNASYAELNLWHGNYGDTISLSNGDTAVISFPAHMSFYLEHLIRAESTTEYWYYQFASRALQLNMLRQEENISLGGTFQNVVSAYNGPVGAGDTVGISYRVYDGFGHHLESLWTQAKSVSVQVAGLGSPRQVIEDEPGVTHLYHPGDPQAEGGITLQGISDIFASIQILNPSSVQTYQETQNYWNGSTGWVIPSNPPIGDWTARVTLNNIGPYQGQTVGEQTFSVRNSTPPANDQFPNAQIVTSMPFNTSLDTYGATQDYDDPSIPKCNLKALAASVWYSFTPTINGTLRLDTIGSDYDTALAVWTGARGSLSLVDCNDDRIISPRDQDSELTVPMVANRTYTILLGKYNGDLLAQSLGPQMASGKLTLNTAGAGTAQLHMSFSSSIPSTVQLISPDGDTLLARSPSFTWAPQPYAVWYTLRVFSGSGKIMFDRTLYAADVCSASLCQYTLHAALSNDNYTWRVLAGNTIGSSYWSSNKIFVVDSDIPFTIFIPFIRK